MAVRALETQKQREHPQMSKKMSNIPMEGKTEIYDKEIEKKMKGAINER